MKKIQIKQWLLKPVYMMAALVVFAACNKDVPGPTPIAPAPIVGSSIATIINSDPNYSLLKAAVTKAGLVLILADSTRNLTLFAPDDAAFAASGVSADVINALPAAQLAAILSYHLVPERLPAAAIGTVFPNRQTPSFINPAPSVSALLRLTNFPSANNGAWLNNIPIKAVDRAASNGWIHTVAGLVMPPQRFVWDRIDTDPGLTYLKAAIKRADVGSPSASSLEGALKNIGANVTVFAPTDAAMQMLLTGLIYQQLVGQGMPPGDALAAAQQAASTPDIIATLPVETMRGIVVYHLFGPGLPGRRAFTNNFSPSPTFYPTVLNSVLADHPGVLIQVSFGPNTPFVTAATVKGVGNAAAANFLIDPRPEPTGSSDQHYLNGVLHKIDQVLLPQ